MPTRRDRAVWSALAVVATSGAARAHHEALFGPQSSLAVESRGFVSLQAHARAYGIGGTETQEAGKKGDGRGHSGRNVGWSEGL